MAGKRGFYARRMPAVRAVIGVILADNSLSQYPALLRSLLHLLLCLCVVANAASGAWAAVGMAMPEHGATAASGNPPCHEDAGTGAAPAAMTAHDAHPQDNTHAHCKAGHCHCLQHCNATLALLPWLPSATAGNSHLNWTLHDSHGDPSPYRPIRPPIA
jgi:hypothetical protein